MRCRAGREARGGTCAATGCAQLRLAGAPQAGAAGMPAPPLAAHHSRQQAAGGACSRHPEQRWGYCGAVAGDASLCLDFQGCAGHQAAMMPSCRPQLHPLAALPTHHTLLNVVCRTITTFTRKNKWTCARQCVRGSSLSTAARRPPSASSHSARAHAARPLGRGRAGAQRRRSVIAVAASQLSHRTRGTRQHRGCRRRTSPGGRPSWPCGLRVYECVWECLCVFVFYVWEEGNVATPSTHKTKRTQELCSSHTQPVSTHFVSSMALQTEENTASIDRLPSTSTQQSR